MVLLAFDAPPRLRLPRLLRGAYPRAVALGGCGLGARGGKRRRFLAVPRGACVDRPADPRDRGRTPAAFPCSMVVRAASHPTSAKPRFPHWRATPARPWGHRGGGGRTRRAGRQDKQK